MVNDDTIVRKSNVFVVYGRDEDRKNAIFIFLRALGLNPLEWEEALQLTKKTSPSTLEIVKAGIENAQAVIVLFTGDDFAKLRSVLGTENSRLQPRPNVIFEAGWALSTLGQERTILVSFGLHKVMSDVDGINYINLTNSPNSRKALFDRLKVAGCALKETGSDYLTVEGGGDFESRLDNDFKDDLETYSSILDRGKFTEFVADSSLYFGLNSIDLHKEFFSDLKEKSYIDLKQHYLGPTCASNWIDLCHHPHYGHADLKSAIESNFDAIIDCLLSNTDFSELPMDLISLGSGDGEIDSSILFKLIERKIKTNYYYCIDISFELLQYATRKIIRNPWINKNLRVKAIQGDFTNLERLSPIYRFDKSINLFVLTGFTLGNYNEAILLKSVRDGMVREDFLFLDVNLHDLNEWDGFAPISKKEQDNILNRYVFPLNDKFAFGPVEMATNLQLGDIEIKHEINREITVVPKALNIVFYCTDFCSTFRGSSEKIKKDRLELGATTLYLFDGIKEWFFSKGYEVIWSKKVNNNRIGLFLLKKI